MIKKLNEELNDEAEQLSPEVGGRLPLESLDRDTLIEKFRSVAGALKRLSQGAVTRVALSDAVRTSLHEILSQDREALFPELRELRSRLDAKLEEADSIASDLRLRHEASRERLTAEEERSREGIQRVSERVAAQESSLASRLEALEALLHAHAAAALAAPIAHPPPLPAVDLESEIERRVAERIAGLRAELLAASQTSEAATAASQAETRRTVDDLVRRTDEQSAGLSQRLEALRSAWSAERAETQSRANEAQVRLDGVRQEIEARQVAALESAAQQTAALAARESARIEEKLTELSAMHDELRRQTESTLTTLKDRVGHLLELVEGIHASVPPRQWADGLDEKVSRLEGRLRGVTDQIEGLGQAAASLRGLGDEFQAVRTDVGALSGEVSTSLRETHEGWDSLTRRILDVQDLVRGGIERWEGNRVGVRQRLMDLRDTLRDPVLSLDQRAEMPPQKSAGMLQRLLGRGDGQTPMTQEEWERLRAHLHTVVQGLETLLEESR